MPCKPTPWSYANLGSLRGGFLGFVSEAQSFFAERCCCRLSTTCDWFERSGSVDSDWSGDASDLSDLEQDFDNVAVDGRLGREVLRFNDPHFYTLQATWMSSEEFRSLLMEHSLV